MNVYEAEWYARERISAAEREAEQARRIRESLAARPQTPGRWHRFLSRLHAVTHDHGTPADCSLSMTRGQRSVQ